MNALQDIHVVDFSKVLAGPLCAQCLGDLGADVIKVEPVEHGDHRPGRPQAGQLGEGDCPRTVCRARFAQHEPGRRAARPPTASCTPGATGHAGTAPATTNAQPPSGPLTTPTKTSATSPSTGRGRPADGDTAPAWAPNPRNVGGGGCRTSHGVVRIFIFLPGRRTCR